MHPAGYTLFETTIGDCGIAWAGEVVTGTELPQRDTLALRARLRARFRSLDEVAPPPIIQRVIDGITSLLTGEARDLLDVELDDSRVPPFHRLVYGITRQIPPGATLTYGEVAKRVGDPTAARAVGQALGRNPFPIIVPCHRVLAAGGGLGGFTAEGGIVTKQRMLQIEGAPLPPTNLSLF